MRVILVPFSDRPESKTALGVAAGLADRVGANVVGCHLRPHREMDKDYQAFGLPLFGSPKKEWLEQLAKKSTDSAAKRAGKSFAELMTAKGFRLARRPSLKLKKGAIWIEQVGLPDKLMAIMGPLSDLTVVSRPAANGHIARMFLLAALLQSSRPVLILPANQVRIPGKRIAIAWNQSAESARVVSACMPLLETAEQVTIISCGPEGRLGPKAKHLQSYLKNYGVDAAVKATRGKDEVAELLATYKETKSDLLLMGAYSRARFREMVFGGMTQYMLTKAKIPVVMQHS
jgi:nucleotide-binding universal stress UspA family protein